MSNSAVRVGRPVLRVPLRRLESVTHRRRRHRCRTAASHGVGCAPECFLRTRSGVIGFPDPNLASAFPLSPSRSSSFAGPARFRLAGSSSPALGLLFRVRTPHVCPLARAPSLGSCPSSRPERTASTSCGRPEPATFRPRRFSRPRRFPPPPASRVCFVPLPRPGFTPQGFSSAHSGTGFRPPLPSCRSAFALPRCSRGARPPAAAFRALLRAPIRHAPQGLGRVAFDPLSSFSFLGFFFARRSDGFTPSPPSAFLGPRRLHDERPDESLRLPRSRFVACPPLPPRQLEGEAQSARRSTRTAKLDRTQCEPCAIDLPGLGLGNAKTRRRRR
jgi:hypothetical protein